MVNKIKNFLFLWTALSASMLRAEGALLQALLPIGPQEGVISSVGDEAVVDLQQLSVRQWEMVGGKASLISEQWVASDYAGTYHLVRWNGGDPEQFVNYLDANAWNDIKESVGLPVHQSKYAKLSGQNFSCESVMELGCLEIAIAGSNGYYSHFWIHKNALLALPLDELSESARYFVENTLQPLIDRLLPIR